MEEMIRWQDMQPGDTMRVIGNKFFAVDRMEFFEYPTRQYVMVFGTDGEWCAGNCFEPICRASTANQRWQRPPCTMLNGGCRVCFETLLFLQGA
jgi:hypothetical protein